MTKERHLPGSIKTKEQIIKAMRKCARYDADNNAPQPHPRELHEPALQYTCTLTNVKRVSVIPYNEPAVGLLMLDPCRLPGIDLAGGRIRMRNGKIRVDNNRTLEDVACGALDAETGIDAPIANAMPGPNQPVLRKLWYDSRRCELVYWYDCQNKTRTYQRKHAPKFRWISPEELPLDGRMRDETRDYLCVFYAYCKDQGLILPDWPMEYAEHARRIQPLVHHMMSATRQFTPYEQSRP
jgi:hypothetical protein